MGNSKIFFWQENFVLDELPDPGSYAVGIDFDGYMKKIDSNGIITLIGFAGTSSGGTQSLQGVMDISSFLSKDNNINGGGNNLLFSNVSIFTASTTDGSYIKLGNDSTLNVYSANDISINSNNGGPISIVSNDNFSAYSQTGQVYVDLDGTQVTFGNSSSMEFISPNAIYSISAFGTSMNDTDGSSFQFGGSINMSLHSPLNIDINPVEALLINGIVGVSGSVIISQGIGRPPIWGTSSVSGVNIYNSNGTLSGNRVINGGNNSLTFQDTNGQSYSDSDGSYITFGDSNFFTINSVNSIQFLSGSSNMFINDISEGGDINLSTNNYANTIEFTSAGDFYYTLPGPFVGGSMFNFEGSIGKITLGSFAGTTFVDSDGSYISFGDNSDMVIQNVSGGKIIIGNFAQLLISGSQDIRLESATFSDIVLQSGNTIQLNSSVGQIYTDLDGSILSFGNYTDAVFTVMNYLTITSSNFYIGTSSALINIIDGAITYNGISIQQDGSGQIFTHFPSDPVSYQLIGWANDHVVIDPLGSGNYATSALLTLNSTTKGFRPPLMSTADKLSIVSPDEGLIIYDDGLKKLCVHNGTGWETITSI